MNNFFWVAMACCHFTFGYAQTSKRTSSTGAQSPTTLARHLTQGLSSDSAKVYAFFDWITSNIDYDVAILDNIAAITAESQRPKQVLQSRKAVCQGYANLFYELCRLSNIPVELIEGYCRYPQTDPNQLTLHAWNAVKVSGKWYIVDATWGTGYIDLDKGGRYTREQNMAYYLATPERISQTHFPFDPLWQLSYHPKTKAAFVGSAKGSAKALDTNIFNYADTLKVYEQSDSLVKKIQAYRRMHAFDPSNDEPKVRLAYHYNHLATQAMNQYSGIRKAVKTPDQLLKQKSQLSQLLNYVESLYTNSLKFTDGISSKSAYYSNINDNRKIIEYNMAVIRDERNFIKKNAPN